MDSDSSGTFTGHGWLNEPCTLITVNHGPFDDVWMYTQAGLNGLSITLGPDSSGAYVPSMRIWPLESTVTSERLAFELCPEPVHVAREMRIFTGTVTEVRV